MHHVTPAMLLHAWELGMADCARGARERALLGAARPDLGEPQRGSLSVGQCDRLLLELREHIFGSGFEAWVACPQCGQGLELRFDAGDIRTDAGGGDGPWTVAVDGCEVCFRAPTFEDMVRIACGPAERARRSELLESLVIDALRSGERCAASDLPETVVDAIEDVLEQDGGVALELGVTCEACGVQWNAPFDLGSFLWTELERWATRLLWEVHALARAYAWKESDLIAMSPWRRQRYLEMLGG